MAALTAKEIRAEYNAWKDARQKEFEEAEAKRSANEKLAQEAVLHRIRTLRHAAAISAMLSLLFLRSNQATWARLLVLFHGVTPANMTRTKLAMIMREVNKTSLDVHKEVITKLADEVLDTARIEAKYYSALPAAVIGASAVTVTAAEAAAAVASGKVAVQAITTADVLAVSRSTSVLQMVLGETTLEAWAERLAVGYAQRVVSTAAQSIREGKNAMQAVEAMQASGLTANQQRNLVTLTHQAITAISADAREAMARQNEDLIRFRLWLSTLDNKTSPMCIVRDHVLYTIALPVVPINDGDPDYGAGPGKLHWRCRSTEVWVLKDATDLGLKGKSRASLDGEVPATMNYRQWLAKASPDVQEEVLGITRADLLRSGKYKVEDFFDDGRMLRLSELK